MRGGAEWIRTLGSACLARKRPIFAIFLSPRRNPIEVSPVPGLILKKVERWLSVFVQRDDLAVDNRLIGQLIQCLSDCREAPNGSLGRCETTPEHDRPSSRQWRDIHPT